MRLVKRLMRGLGAVGVAAAVATLGFGTPALASNSTQYGCPSGYACLYADAANPPIYLPSRPTHMWYTYGVHNLSNVYGWRSLLNNQTGGWSVYICYGYNGTNCVDRVQQDAWYTADWGPINSIVLKP